VLRALLDAALRAGRRVRHETALGRGAVGIPALGAELLAKELEGLEPPRVVLVGAGEMGSALARRLADHGVELRITSRTELKARALADELGAGCFALGELAGELARADGLAVAVSGGPVQGLEAWWMAGSGLRGALDLGAPASLAGLGRGQSGCVLVGLEEIEALARARRARRAEEVPAAEAIVAQEAARFGRWLRARAGRALADDVMRELERRREEALDRLLGAASPEERLQADFLTRRLLASVAHDLAETIRSLHPENPDELELVRRLFGLARPDSQGLPAAKARTDAA
jgi:glutamyl-tRNA reductase